jgi:hypothetical protein
MSMRTPTSGSRALHRLGLVLLVCLLGLGADPALGAEKVDRTDLPRNVASAIGTYSSKSRACLDKLVGIIEQGSERSVSLWESQCKTAEGQLMALVKVEGVSTSAGKWVMDEITAWSRMASVGKSICYVNELLVRQIVHLQWCRDQTEREKVTVTRQVRDAVRSVLTELGSEARDVLNGADDLDKLGDKLLLGGGEGLREIINKAASFDDEVGEVLDMEDKVATTQRYLELLADSMRRRKTRFLQDNDRFIVRLRQDLARLVSAKIDPDGRGVFTNYENRIEKAALKNLDEYEEELDKWKAANKTFLGNALDFGKTFVNPAVSNASSLVPYGGGAMTFVKLVKMAGSFMAAVDPFLESVKQQAERRSGALYDKVLAASGNLKESLQELKAEKDVAILKLQKQRAQDASEFDSESKAELRLLQSQLDAATRGLKQLPDGKDEERADLEAQIEELGERLRAEPVALKRRHAHHERGTERMVKALAEKYDERIELMEKRIKDTVAVGGEIK